MTAKHSIKKELPQKNGGLEQGLIIIGKDGFIVSANKVAGDILGVPSNGLSGQKISDQFNKFTDKDGYPLDADQLGNILTNSNPGTVYKTLVGISSLESPQTRWVFIHSLQQAIDQILLLLDDVTDLIGAKLELKDRAKELQAFFSLSEISENNEIPIDELLILLSDTLPKSLKYPELACCKIQYKDIIQTSSDYCKPIQKIKSIIRIDDKEKGFIEIGYTETCPDEFEGPFLFEERLLLDSFTERLGRIIERRQTAEFMKTENEYSELIIKATRLGKWRRNFKKDEFYFDDNACQHFGLTKHTLKAEDFWSHFHPKDIDRIHLELREARENIIRSPLTSDYRVIHQYGAIRWVRVNYQIEFIETRNGFVPNLAVGTSQDITNQKKAEEELGKKNRALLVLSNCNNALLKSTGETDLLEEICRVCVDDGDYKLAWVGFFEHDPGEPIRVVAQHGLIVENVISLTPTRGLDPFTRTVSTRKPVILQNICKDKNFTSWQETATKYGFESFISLPIVIDGSVTGVLALLSSEPFSFKTDEVFLLNKLSNNLAYGIKTLRSREEQNRLEEELRVSESRYKLAQQSASVGSWEWDLSTDEVFWSDEIFHFIEKQPGEYAPTKSALSDFVIPEDWAIVKQVLRNALKSKIPFDLEFRIRVYSGNLKWINAKGNVIKDTFGKPILVTGTMQDVSHRKEMEEALKSTNDKYKLISENSTDVISVMDVKSERFTFISPSVFKLRGYKTAEVMQQTLADVFTPDSYQKAKNFFKQSIPDVNDGQPSISFVMELDQVRKDGSIVPTEITFTQAYDDSGNLQVISIARDITKRKKSETELREERNLFQVLMDNLPDGIYFKNLRSRFLRINKAEASIFGLQDPAKAIGKTDFDFFTNEHAQVAYNDEQEIIRSGKPIYNYEEKETFPDGHNRWISTSKLPFRNTKGEIIGTFGISHDITHRKEMELSLQQRVKELETVYQISNRIQTGETVKELLQNLLVETLNVIQSSDGGIFLFEPSENKLALDAAIGWFEQLQGLTLEPNEGINGHVFSTNEPYISQDMVSDQFLASKVKNVIPEGQSGGFFPIQCSEGIIGVLDVYVPHPRIISENEQRLLIIIAQMAGGVIQRSRLTDELSQINTNLQIEIDQKNVFQSLLAAEKELLSTTLMSLGEGVIITDKDGLIVLFNKAAESITGYLSNEIFEKPLYTVFQIIDPSTNNIMPEIIDNLYQMNQAQQEEPNYKPPTLITKSGGRILVSSIISMLKKPDGQFMGHVIVFQNITGKQMADAQSALSQKMEAIGQLAAGIAHEINTPIQYIGDNLRFLQKSISRFSEMLEACHILENDQPIRQDCINHLLQIKNQTKIEQYIKESPVAVQEALDGVERVRKIVLAMREFSHPSEKEKKFANINHGIETTVVISKNEWKYCVELETDLDPELPPVFCQIDEINQVILNMIINSVHAIEEVIPPGTDQKGKIKISTKKAGDQVIIKIRDSGKGIPEEIKQRIFDPFFTTKGVGKGTGQGLSLAHHIIIKKHHGTINVDSTVGVGTTFTIALPIESPE